MELVRGCAHCVKQAGTVRKTQRRPTRRSACSSVLLACFAKLVSIVFRQLSLTRARPATIAHLGRMLQSRAQSGPSTPRSDEQALLTVSSVQQVRIVLAPALPPSLATAILASSAQPAQHPRHRNLALHDTTDPALGRPVKTTAQCARVATTAQLELLTRFRVLVASTASREQSCLSRAPSARSATPQC